MTTRDLKMLNLLRLLYREEEFFQSDKLFRSEVDIYRFKTDCARILSVFPDKEVLFEFDKNCVNNKYKLLVYSYIFNVMYDEDVYHKYEYSYENLSVDAGLYYTYMRFVTTVFEAQLEWNRDYPFFYKKWRYLKLYLATVLYADSIVDMQYLWYIAKWLKNNPNYDSFAETIFTNNGELRDEKEMHDSLEIAVARGILDCKESETDGVNNYVFRTIFYYFAFLGSAKNKLDESKIFNQEDSGDIEEVIEENALTMIEKFGELSDSDQMTVLSSVYHQKLNPEARESFRKDIGNQNHNVIVDEAVVEALATPIGADDPNARDLQLWNKHAEMLPWIREYVVEFFLVIFHRML